MLHHYCNAVKFFGSRNPKTRAREGGASVFTSFVSFSFSVPPPSEKIAGGFQRAGKKEGVWGEGIFARLPKREAAGRSVQNSQSGFSSKKVRISSNKHHQSLFAEELASLGASRLASAGISARKCQGFLKSIANFPAARRRFTNEICFARRAMSRFFSFAFGERQSEILLNCRCGVSFFNYN